MARRRRAGPVILALLLVAAVAAAIAMALRRPPVPVDLGAVAREPMQVTIDEEGETRARDVYVVAAPVGGRLLRVAFEPGDTVVARRSVVARLLPSAPTPLDARLLAQSAARVRALDASLAAAQARVAEAEAARRLADRELERQTRLQASGFVAEAVLDRARTAHDQAEAALLEARRAVDAARFDLAGARAAMAPPTAPGGQGPVDLRAPVSGAVLRVLRESESVVAAGTPLLEIGDPADIEIVADLLSEDAVRVRPGAPALVEEWGGERPLHARVRRIEPSGFLKLSALGVEEQRVNVILDFDEAPAARPRLGHGYRVMVRIVGWSSPAALTVPASALFRSGDTWTLFVAEKGRARRVAVKVGHINPDRAELLTELPIGARVILHPSDKVADGVRIAVRAP